jgi:hypothetical protein
MTQIGIPASKTAGVTLRAFNRLEWTMLTIGSILCGVVCVGIAGMLGVPGEPHFDGSLLLGGSPIVGAIAAVCAVLVAMLIGSLAASFVEREAGLFCCCIGLATLGVRCGSIRPVLQYAPGTGVFRSLAGESVLLGALLIGGWVGLRMVLDQVMLKKDVSSNHAAPNELTKPDLQTRLSALGLQMLTMAIVEMVLIQSDAKAQAMAGVFLGGYFGSLAGYFFAPLSEGIWFWAGPIAVGLVGYLLNFFSADALLTGDIHGWAAALGRATPLDYAGMGTTGALLGYWSMRRWSQPAEENDEETVAA